VEKEMDIIDIAIGEDMRFRDTSKKMCTVGEGFCLNPRRSITKFLVLEYGNYKNKPVTKLLLRPITGRRHQLRLSCQEIGHTIVGDYTYSSKTDICPPRMFLHAFRLKLPNSLENLDIQTEDPFTEKALKNKWKSLSKVNDMTFAFDKIDLF
jgi:23S rRNA-/tRNA-specific pseudouridylate synthase